ncbi:MAG TPA: DUF3048 domain-containing protein [Actinophytocola sp.]|uniref:DUF3048 domain-containing protein n=1 Tax=Actinophytocola sp. TaxID=1872138 RepID=UPI002DB638D5|nr:DUF3048 domain-containing protein [Actinophytocola sp.]HEU5471404.1 DUF3048 domain-containing protein [Actinophytocola sp.]
MRGQTPNRARLWWTVGLTIAVVIAAVALITRGPSTYPGTPNVAPGTTPTATAPAVPPAGAPGLAVKIDNVRDARPATGLGAADVVYVEPVEGGLTRLVALYDGEVPAVIGPVRSARRTDIELLGQYGRPVFAYSGAAPELLPALRAANLVNASPAEVPGAYHRGSEHSAPHNLYLSARRLPGGSAAPATPALQYGAAPATGAPSTRLDVRYPASSFTFIWSGEDWQVSMDGTPLSSTESGRLSAATVIEQRVVITAAESTVDGPGGSPVARTVGRGSATVLRDGQRFDATWSRPAAGAPTRFHTASGLPLPLAPGPVWILLVPA